MTDHSEDIGYLKAQVAGIKESLDEYKPKFDSVLEFVTVEKAKREAEGTTKTQRIDFYNMTLSGILAAAAGAIMAFIFK